jgi:hypothetical protein
MRLAGLTTLALLALVATASALAPQGTFSGPVHCVGQDR